MHTTFVRYSKPLSRTYGRRLILLGGHYILKKFLSLKPFLWHTIGIGLIGCPWRWLAWIFLGVENVQKECLSPCPITVRGDQISTSKSGHVRIRPVASLFGLTKGLFTSGRTNQNVTTSIVARKDDSRSVHPFPCLFSPCSLQCISLLGERSYAPGLGLFCSGQPWYENAEPMRNEGKI